MKIVHISDTHGARGHTPLEIPECDVLIHSGDLGGRTSPLELAEFLAWFQGQPGRKKIFIAGNHDICMDPKWGHKLEREGKTIEGMLADQQFQASMDLINAYMGITYLNGKDYVYEGVKFWGSPVTPSFHRQYWVFNADRGSEIMKEWAKIPSDVDVLITHGPPYGILDQIEDKYLETGETETHKGCKDLRRVMTERLHKLKLHCFGHIHETTGVLLHRVSNKRRVLFSNGSVLNNEYTQLITKPLIITI